MNTTFPRLLILLVEDEVFLRICAADFFRDDGFDVIEAGSGEQAMAELANGHSLDALVTDINLGGELTGWEIAEECRTRWPQIAVIYTSGEPGDDLRSVKGSRFFRKPYEVEQIGAACRALCRS